MGNLDFQLTSEKLADGSSVALLHMKGSIDGTTVKKFETKTLGLCEEGIMYLILNFAEVGYMNSTGLGILVKVLDKFQEKNGDVKLVKVPRKVADLFDMLGISSILTIYKSVEEAIDSLPSKIVSGAIKAPQAPAPASSTKMTPPSNMPMTTPASATPSVQKPTPTVTPIAKPQVLANPPQAPQPHLSRAMAPADDQDEDSGIVIAPDEAGISISPELDMVEPSPSQAPSSTEDSLQGGIAIDAEWETAEESEKEEKDRKEQTAAEFFEIAMPPEETPDVPQEEPASETAGIDLSSIGGENEEDSFDISEGSGIPKTEMKLSPVSQQEQSLDDLQNIDLSLDLAEDLQQEKDRAAADKAAASSDLSAQEEREELEPEEIDEESKSESREEESLPSEEIEEKKAQADEVVEDIEVAEETNEEIAKEEPAEKADEIDLQFEELDQNLAPATETKPSAEIPTLDVTQEELLAVQADTKPPAEMQETLDVDVEDLPAADDLTPEPIAESIQTSADEAEKLEDFGKEEIKNAPGMPADEKEKSLEEIFTEDFSSPTTSEPAGEAKSAPTLAMTEKASEGIVDAPLAGLPEGLLDGLKGKTEESVPFSLDEKIAPPEAPLSKEESLANAMTELEEEVKSMPLGKAEEIQKKVSVPQQPKAEVPAPSEEKEAVRGSGGSWANVVAPCASRPSEVPDEVVDAFRDSEEKVLSEMAAKQDTSKKRSGVTAKPASKIAQALKRKTTVRYYEQMNPATSYPLAVVLSKDKVAAPKTPHVVQKEGKKEVVVSTDKPQVTIVPCLSGCLVSPASVTIDATPETAQADFWVTPIIEGAISGWIDIIYEGKLIEKISLHTRCVKQTWAKIGAVAAFLSPFLSYFMSGFSWKADMLEGLPRLLALIDAQMGLLSFGLLTMILFGVAGTIFYLKNKPKKAEIQDDFISA